MYGDLFDLESAIIAAVQGPGRALTGDDHGRGSPGRLQTRDDSLRADLIDGRFGAVSGHATCASALT